MSNHQRCTIDLPKLLSFLNSNVPDIKVYDFKNLHFNDPLVVECASHMYSLEHRSKTFIKKKKKLVHTFLKEKFVADKGISNEQAVVIPLIADTSQPTTVAEFANDIKDETFEMVPYGDSDSELKMKVDASSSVEENPLNHSYGEPGSIISDLDYAEFSNCLNNPATAKTSSFDRHYPENITNSPSSSIPNSVKSLYRSKSSFRVPLPLGTYNDLENKRGTKLTFSHCSFLEGTFFMSKEEFEDIREGKLLRNYYITIRRKFESVNNTCPVNFKKAYCNKEATVYSIQAYCCHTECKTFLIKMICIKNIVKGRVLSSSKNYCHKPGEKKTPFVRNFERRLLGEALRTTTPYMARIRDENATPAGQISVGNCRDIKSTDVYSKIKSEELAIYDRDRDEMIDLVKMREENQNYIYRVSVPLSVYIFSNEQLSVIKHLINRNKNSSNNLTLHLDATGSVVHAPPPSKKRVYYYAGVVHIPEKKIVCPVLEMVTSEHKASSIASWLLAFQEWAISNKLTWPVFNVIVTDFSFALINAILVQWNLSQNLSQYVNIIYDDIERARKGLPTIRTKITLKLCCCHFMKIIAQDVNKLCVDNKIQKKFFKTTLASVFSKTSLESVENWFKHFVLVTTNRFQNESVTASLLALTVGNYNGQDQPEYSNDSTSNDENAYATLFEKSKFFSHFKIIFEKYDNISSGKTNEPSNTHYHPQMAELVLKKYLPFLPLWSNIIPGESKMRYSNAVVENWFGKVKNNILPGKHLRCSRFLRAVREVVVGIAKEISLDIGKTGLAIGKRKREKDDSGLEAEEYWQQKKSKTSRLPTYFNNFLKNSSHIPVTAASAVDDSKLKQINVSHSCHNFKFYSNRLIKDSNYYRYDGHNSYVCGLFPGVQPFAQLYIDDFETLSCNESPRKMWLSNFIIDFCLNVFFRNSAATNISYVSTIETVNIFSEQITEQSEISISTKGRCILPLIMNNHWHLGIVDFDKKTFAFINPLRSSLAQTKTFMHKFLKYVQNRNLDVSFDNWKPVVLDHPLQRDSYNCGVYVLAFAEKFVTDKEPNLFQCTEPESFRIKLKNMLLENSDSVRDICLVCGQSENDLDETKTNWIQCSHCKRWIMFSCLSSTPTDTSGIYTCFVCQYYFRP